VENFHITYQIGRYPENFWITPYLSGLSRNFQYKKLLDAAHYRLAKRQLAQSLSDGEESETAHLQGKPTIELETSEEPATVTVEKLLQRADSSPTGESNQPW
jgi:hypothetical protein